MVGAERFELPTSCSQSRRSTRLSYAPRPEEAQFLRGAVRAVRRNLFLSGALLLSPVRRSGTFKTFPRRLRARDATTRLSYAPATRRGAVSEVQSGLSSGISLSGALLIHRQIRDFQDLPEAPARSGRSTRLSYAPRPEEAQFQRCSQGCPAESLSPALCSFTVRSGTFKTFPRRLRARDALPS